MQDEPALTNRLDCAKNLPMQAEPEQKYFPTHAEHALKKLSKQGKKVMHTEPALTICLRKLSLR
jgi:hypothetical protein